MAVLMWAMQISFADVATDKQYYNKQWGLMAVHAPAVWEITTGSTNVYVAVADSCIDSRHEDKHSMSFGSNISCEDGE